MKETKHPTTHFSLQLFLDDLFDGRRRQQPLRPQRGLGRVQPHKHERGQALNLQRAREFIIRVDINLDDAHRVPQLGGHGFQFFGQQQAGAAPRRKKIDDERAVAVGERGLQLFRVDLFDL